MFEWSGFQVVLPRELGSLFEFVYSLVSKFKSMGGFIMIWKRVIWSICLVRNDGLFLGSSYNVIEVENKSIHLAWTWFLNSSMLKSPSFSNWLQKHILCLSQWRFEWFGLAPPLVNGFKVACGVLLLLMVGRMAWDLVHFFC